MRFLIPGWPCSGTGWAVSPYEYVMVWITPDFPVRVATSPILMANRYPQHPRELPYNFCFVSIGQ